MGGDSYPYYIKGTASVAIEFNFEPDRNEIQLIVLSNVFWKQN